MTQRQLALACGRWRRRLGLEEWRIHALFVPHAKLQTNADRNVYGHTEIDFYKHKATVLICNPEDMALFDPGLPIEATLIHELGHVLLDPSQRIADDALFELGLDRLAAALLKAYEK
jgi:hypothetical protein